MSTTDARDDLSLAPGEDHSVGRSLAALTLTPVRMALVYLLFGAGFLYVSDVLLVAYLSEPRLSQVQAVKAGVEVLLTAGLIFVLTDRYRAQLEETTEQLAHRNTELQVLHRVLRHNLRNDLTVIRTSADQLCTKEVPNAPCDRIVSSVDRITHYTDQSRQINRFIDAENEPTTVDLGRLVPAIVADHSELTDGVEVSVDVPETAPVIANEMLRPALCELVTNAVVHSGADPRIHIAVAPADDRSDVTEIRVSDNGPGIPEAELSVLRQGREDQLVHLSGLGLWIVYWTVERSAGEVSIAESDMGGTTVRIRLPTAETV